MFESYNMIQNKLILTFRTLSKRNITNDILQYKNSRFKNVNSSSKSRKNNLANIITTKKREQFDFIKTITKNANDIKILNWDNIRQNILNNNYNTTDTNLDATVITGCMQNERLDLALSYVSFLNEKNVNINVATIGKILKLFYFTYKGQNINNETEEKILHFADILSKKTSILDANTAENLIHALSLTTKWNDCLKLIDEIKITSTPSASTYSAVAIAAFINKNEELGWNILTEMNSNNRPPLPSVFIQWINVSEKNKKTYYKDIEKMLNYHKKNYNVIEKTVAEKLLQSCKINDVLCRETKITKRGLCTQCSEKLQAPILNKDEFSMLKERFYKNVMLGKNLFTKTTPEELTKFSNFIETNNTCDIVLDGLNIAYSAGVQKSPLIYAKLLASVVDHFIQRSQRVMVLGRTHMRKWPKSHMDYIYNNASVFLTQNLSQDDPFLLYATMLNGPNTGFISRDLMRGHAFRLGDTELTNIFKRWQHQNQHQLIFVENNGTVHLKYPLKITPAVQKNENHWHIPIEDNVANQLVSFDVPKNWLCLKFV